MVLSNEHRARPIKLASSLTSISTIQTDAQAVGYIDILFLNHDRSIMQYLFQMYNKIHTNGQGFIFIVLAIYKNCSQMVSY